MVAERPPTSDAAETFLGRQPILDRQQALFGYELLFRSSHENHADVTNPSGATADVVCKAFSELGLADALGTNRAFINVDCDLLASDAIELLPPSVVVLEISAAEILDEVVYTRCCALKSKGYEVSVAGLELAMNALPRLGEIATYVKIDIDAVLETELASTVSQAKGNTWKLIASRVESLEAMQRCMTLGFDYFQGYYFAHPIILEGRKLDTSTQGLMQLINLIHSDAEAGTLEAAFKHEPGLTINLLRLVNSVGVGASTRISSVKHAITVLGRRQLGRWLQLLVYSNGTSGQPIATNPLMQHAALRGYFMEQIARVGFPENADLKEQAFLTGLMSLLPVALCMAMSDILEKITVAQDVRAALTHHEGELGILLALTERYDDNDMPGTAALLARLGGRANFNSLSTCLASTIAWIQRIGSDA